MDSGQDTIGKEKPSTSNIKKASNLNPNAPFFEPSSLRHSESVLAYGTFGAGGPDEANIPYNSEFMHHDTELPVVWNGGIPLEWNVEDFSAEWWELIQNNEFFRQNWMREYHAEDGNVSMGEFHISDEGYYLEAEFLPENENVATRKDEQKAAESFHMEQMTKELNKLGANLEPH